jgi:hypothetical protein
MLTLVAIAGITACLAYLRQAPRALGIAAAALAALVAANVFQWIAEPLIYRTLGPQNQGGLLVSNALGVLSLLTGFVRALAVGGLIAAVFIDRPINFRRVGP